MAKSRASIPTNPSPNTADKQQAGLDQGRPQIDYRPRTRPGCDAMQAKVGIGRKKAGKDDEVAHQEYPETEHNLLRRLMRGGVAGAQVQTGVM
jgi:hypothetical protein